MTRSELASYIDHTILKPDTTSDAVARICAEAAELGCVAVCIPPRHVPLAVKLLADTEVHIATVAGFPNGDTLSSVKADETKAVIDLGAHEVDMVIPIGAARENDWKTVSNDIHAVVHAGHGHAIIKVIIEAAYLSDEQKVQACICAKDAGDTVGVKAAGGIRDLPTALAMIEAGATRLGCSASVAILEALGGGSAPTPAASATGGY